MKQVSHEEVTNHEGGTVCGPIPAFLDQRAIDLWVQQQAEGHSYCVVLYPEVKEFGEDEAMYSRIQGTFWVLRDSESTYQIDIH